MNIFNRILGIPPSTVDIDDLERNLSNVFTPASPISTPELLKGRENVMEDVRHAFRRKGACIVMFGDRGVGKTSIAKVSMKLVAGDHFYYSVSANDSFDSIAIAILTHYDVQWSVQSRGETETTEKDARADIKVASGGLLHRRETIAQEAPITTDVLTSQEICTRLPQKEGLVIIDDFERISARSSRIKFADLVKKVSDNEIPITFMFVGIARNIDELLLFHESAARSITEIKISRLRDEDIQKIVNDGMDSLGIQINPEHVDHIVSYSARFPYYTHLLCEGAVTHMIAKLRDGTRNSYAINHDDLNASVNYAIRNAEHSISTAYEAAVRNIKDSQRFKYTLYALASSPHEPLPYREISEWVRGVSRASSPINISHQLKILERAKIIERVGKGFYRFTNPILKDFVILKARSDSPAYELQAIDSQIKDTQKRLDRLGERIRQTTHTEQENVEQLNATDLGNTMESQTPDT